MLKPFAVTFAVPARNWLTTTGDENSSRRAKVRHDLRAYGKRVWSDALRAGCPRVDRFMLWVTIGGRPESPVLSAETLKPLIDAATDMHVWPDDDPYHRVCTCYMPDPRRAPQGNAIVSMWVIPLDKFENPAMELIASVPGARGTGFTLEVPDRDWLTSNMKLSAPERKAKQGRIMRSAAMLWNEDAPLGADAAVLFGVRYPDSRKKYQGDPDNTAETATAIWGAGAAKLLCPASPSLFGFYLLGRHPSRPKHHEMAMTAFTVPKDYSWLDRLK
jgi:hypothetical protein